MCAPIAPGVPPVKADSDTSPSDAVAPTMSRHSSHLLARQKYTPPKALTEQFIRCSVDDRAGPVALVLPVTTAEASATVAVSIAASVWPVPLEAPPDDEIDESHLTGRRQV